MKLKIELELEYTTHWADDAKVEVADIPALGLKTQAKPENIERAAISAAQMWLQICLDRGTILAWKKAGLRAAVSASRPYEIGLNERLKDPVYAAAYTKALIEDGASASPQPRCPKCHGKVVLRNLFNEPTAFCAVQCPTCIPTDGFWLIRMAEDMAQFFAAAPAHTEPDYNRAYTILGEALNLNPEFYGLVEMAQVAAKRLTGKYDVAAQEQPVENSPQKGNS